MKRYVVSLAGLFLVANCDQPQQDEEERTTMAAGGGTLVLAWKDTANNEDGFHLDRRPGTSTNWTRITTLGADMETHTDIPPSRGEEYCYRVRAFNTTGSSAWSKTACGTLPLVDGGVPALDLGGGCHAGAMHGWDYCTTSCPCAEGEGDCDSDGECEAGLTCVKDVGKNYGAHELVDVCSCHAGKVYDWDHYCTTSCPCAEGEGDCDSDGECEAGLTCVKDVGKNYGAHELVDICRP